MGAIGMYERLSCSFFAKFARNRQHKPHPFTKKVGRISFQMLYYNAINCQFLLKGWRIRFQKILQYAVWLARTTGNMLGQYRS